MSNDYYAVLGIPREASQVAIRRRFRELARERHPDRFRDAAKERAERDFQAITEAFNVLSDPESRRQHDAELADRTKGSTPREGFDREGMVKAYLSRGIRAYREKRWLEAADSFDRATRIDPERAKAWYYLALAASREERWLGKAREAIERACELEPMNVPYLRAAGRISARAGDLPRARELYEKALEWSADDPEIRAELDALAERPRRGGFARFGKA